MIVLYKAAHLNSKSVEQKPKEVLFSLVFETILFYFFLYLTRYNTTLTICMSEEYASGNVQKHRGLFNFQIKGPLTQRQRFRKTKQKRTFVRLDVKIKRDSLRLIK